MSINLASWSGLDCLKQTAQIEIDAAHRPVRFLGKRFLHVIRPFMGFAFHQHDGQDELLLLVESVEDFVAGDGEGGLAPGAALDLDVAGRRQLAADGWRRASASTGQPGCPRRCSSSPAGMTSAPPSGAEMA